jgi:hypothetical protein
VRLHLTYAPSTVIMKYGAPTPVARQLNRSQAYYKKEITFYERVATSGGVHVPSCYFTAYDTETGSGVLLLEDIVDGRSVHEAEGCVAAELIAAVGAIVSFHSEWWDSAVSEFGFPAWNTSPAIQRCTRKCASGSPNSMRAVLKTERSPNSVRSWWRSTPRSSHTWRSPH